jgi:hypothetical protein
MGIYLVKVSRILRPAVRTAECCVFIISFHANLTINTPRLHPHKTVIFFHTSINS